MRKLLILSALILATALTSCQNRNIYREFHKFDNYTWGRFDKVKFTFPVEDEGAVADIVLSVRYLEQYPYTDLPMNIILTTPSGEERIIERAVVIRDENNQFRGSVAGSYWDVEEVLWKNFFFNKPGNYTIELENLNPRPGIPALVDLGLLVRKAKG